jgi:hypothetical protein
MLISHHDDEPAEMLGTSIPPVAYCDHCGRALSRTIVIGTTESGASGRFDLFCARTEARGPVSVLRRQADGIFLREV